MKGASGWCVLRDFGLIFGIHLKESWWKSVGVVGRVKAVFARASIQALATPILPFCLIAAFLFRLLGPHTKRSLSVDFSRFAVVVPRCSNDLVWCLFVINPIYHCGEDIVC